MRLIVILFLSLSISSCCLTKKVKTETRTETIIKIDTIIVIKKDTITKTKEVFLYDTAFIEIEIARAKSYYDTTKKKIVLQLTGKSFEVPLTINKKVVETIKQKEVTKNNKWIFIFALLLLPIYSYLIYKFLKQ